MYSILKYPRISAIQDKINMKTAINGFLNKIFTSSNTRHDLSEFKITSLHTNPPVWDK